MGYMVSKDVNLVGWLVFDQAFKKRMQTTTSLYPFQQLSILFFYHCQFLGCAFRAEHALCI